MALWVRNTDGALPVAFLRSLSGPRLWGGLGWKVHDGGTRVWLVGWNDWKAGLTGVVARTSMHGLTRKSDFHWEC